MRYAVFFEDNEDRSDQRTHHMQEHLEFLRKHASQIDSAGPLFSENNNAAGGLWLVDVADEEAVTSLVHKDPLWSTGLRKSVTIFNWRRVFCDREILVSKPRTDE